MNIRTYLSIEFVLLILIFYNSYFFQSEINAQYNYKIEQLTSNEGLSHNCVRCVFQDSKGFIWIGTEGGLNKFDGYNIEEYINNPDDLNTISDNWIWTIYEDPADSGKILWFGTKVGLNELNRETGQFTLYNINPIDSVNTSQNWVHCICKVKDGVYLIGGNGLKIFERETRKVKSYLTELSNLHVYSIHKDKSDNFWIGSNLGLFQLSSSLKEKSIDYSSNFSTPVHVLSFYEEKNGNLWIGTDSGFYIYEINEKKIIRPQFKFGNLLNEIIHSMFEDSKGNLLATSNNGLIIINQRRDSVRIFRQLLDNLPSPYSRGNNRPYNQNVISAFVDRAGIIWIGTCCNGVYKFIPDRKKFKLFRHDPNDNYSLGSSLVTSFCEDRNGNIYVGTIGGNLNLFDKKTERFLRIDLSVENYSVKSGLKNDIWYSNYYSLINFDFDNMISTAYFGHGISNTLKFKISQSNEKNDALRKHLWDSLFASFDLSKIRDYPTIDYLYVDKKGNIWCVLVSDNEKSRILNTFDTVTKKFYPYEILINKFGSVSVTNICEDSEGALWFGTEGKGLIKIVGAFDKIGDKQSNIIQYTNDRNNICSISSNHIHAITEDKNGFLWIGTNKGVNKFNPQDQIFTRYGIKDGLPSELISGILVADNGYIWISTNKGLSKFDPLSEKFENFDVRDELQSNNFSIGCNYKAKNGDMYFGGPNGFNLFHPNDIKENPFPPNVVINGFTLFNEQVRPSEDSPLKKNIELADEIILYYDQDIFTFEFVALDYTSPMKNLYAYKMEGVNPDWIYTDANRRFATYTKLDPGEYIFKVKASNNDGIWNEKGCAINVIILPPWWKTWWANSIYIIIIISILIYLYLLQKRRLKIRNELAMKDFETVKLREVDQMKSKFFANISHEFRTPLTLIKGPVEQLLDGKKLEDPNKIFRMIKRNSEKLLNLINELLDLSKLESGKMKLSAQRSDIVTFAKGIVMSFESYAQRKNIQINVKSNKDIVYLYFDKEKMQKILTNLISNACKFTKEKGKITVDIKEENFREKLIIKVEDNGIGISEEDLPRIFDRFYQVVKNEHSNSDGTGIGLALTKELVEMHHGKIEVESQAGTGTTFYISFPLGSDHLSEDEIIYGEKELPEEMYENEELENIASDKEEITLLIVEDNKDVRDFIKSIVEPKYKIIEAENGEDGYKKAIEQVPDLIISDIMMPKMNGEKMTERLRKDIITSHIPIILLTAKASEEDKIEGLETGADDYLIKPFNEKELLARINNLINQRRRLREKYLKEAEINPIEVAVTSLDKKFIESVISYIEENISNSDLNIDKLANTLAVSRAQLYRKFSSLLGERPNDFIRKYRIKRAAELIKKGFGNITEIAYEVGFNDISYFSKCFKNIYKKTPHEYARLNQS